MRAISPAFKSLLNGEMKVLPKKAYFHEMVRWSSVFSFAAAAGEKDIISPSSFFLFHFKIMFRVHNYDTH